MPPARPFDEDAWSDLTTIIELGKRLRFVLVECEGEGVRAALREKLRAHCEAEERPFLAPDRSGRALLGWLIEEQRKSAEVPPADREREQPVRFLPVPTGQDETFTLYRLNENRDNLKRDLRGVLVLAGLHDFLRRVPLDAPDLWSMQEKSFEVSANDLPPLQVTPPKRTTAGPTYLHDAYLSFTHQDREVAERLRDRLVADGVRVFLADAGAPLDRNALSRSRFFVILLSPEYVSVAWPRMEQALRGSRAEHELLTSTVPLLVRPVGTPDYLRRYQPLDWTDDGRRAERDPNYLRLLQALQGRGRELPPRISVNPFGGSLTASAVRVSQEEVQRLPEVWNVPYVRNPTFTGRTDDLDRLRRRLDSQRPPRAPVQAICGLGGVGKTQLALEYAYRYASDYDVIWWIRAGEPATMAADFADLAVALLLPGSVEPDRHTALAAVKQWLGGHDRWLLIFDGAREPEELQGYLPREVAGHVLITSRHAVWREVARPLELTTMKTSEGVELLLARSGAREGQEEAARELCAELGNLPLALAQAGAYIEEAGISIREYLDRFRKRRAELLRRGGAGTDGDTVATTWGVAFAEVQARSPAAAELIDLCAFLAPTDIPADALRRAAPSFPPALAAAVSDSFAFDEAVGALGRYSLIERRDDVLSVHLLVQAIVRDRLPPDERRRWAGIAVALVCEAFPDEPADPAQRSACRRFLPHARAVLGHAGEVGLGPSEPAERLLRHAAHYQYLVGFDAPAREMLEQALRMAEALHGPDHAHVAMALSGLGQVSMRLGDLDGAQRHARRALRIDEMNQGPDSAVVATDLVNLAAIVKEGGALDEAEQLAERALRIDRALGPDNLAAVARDENDLGAILRERGDLAGARRCFERAIAIDEQRSAPDLPLHMNNLGLLLREMGALDDAERLAARALAVGVDLYGKDDPNVATFSSNLGSVLQELGLREPDRKRRYELLREAEGHLRRALEIGVDTYGPDHYVVAIRRNNLGLLLNDLGDMDGAQTELDQAVAIAQKALGAEHPRVRKLENNRAVVLERRKTTRPP